MWQISGQSYVSYLLGFSYIFQKRNNNQFIVNTSFKTIFPDYELFSTKSSSALGLPSFLKNPNKAATEKDASFLKDLNERESPHLGNSLSIPFGLLFLFALLLSVTILLPLGQSSGSSTLYFAEYMPVWIKIDAWLLKLFLCIVILEVIPSVYPKKSKAC